MSAAPGTSTDPHVVLLLSSCCLDVCREIQEGELEKFYCRISKLLQGKDHGHETIDSLQRLRLILSATKFSRT